MSDWLTQEQEAALRRLPSTLIEVAFPRSVELRLHLAVRSVPRVLRASNCAVAATQLQEAGNVCLMLLVPGTNQLDLIGDYNRLLRWYPDVPVVAVFDRVSSSSAALLELGRNGVCEVVECGELEVVSTVVNSLRRCHAIGVSERIWKVCISCVPESLAALLRRALQLAHEPLTVALLAKEMKIPGATLRMRCASAALPAPKWLVSWARVTTAAYFIETYHCSIEDAASALEFPNALRVKDLCSEVLGRGARIAQPRVSDCVDALRASLRKCDFRACQLV